MIETQGSNSEHDMEKLYWFLESEELENGTISSSEEQFYQLWRIREDIPMSQMGYGGPMYSYDINIPDITQIYPFWQTVKKYLTEEKGYVITQGQEGKS